MTGMEPWAISVVSGVAVPIFQILWGSGGKVLGIFGKTLDEKTREMIFTASKQYVQNYEESPEGNDRKLLTDLKVMLLLKDRFILLLKVVLLLKDYFILLLKHCVSFFPISFLFMK
ncbi:hypothetical protein CDG79_39175 [Nostoc sp. 'Peltigera membranacea cyanobiont' 232]|nr:hypothetical protein CDG79_39175 [Nostoc sp. 'Peltigera membranacea cyanobiont' 232]